MSSTPQTAPTPEFAAAFRDFMLQSLEQEQTPTRRVITNVREGDWKPDPKSRSAKELAWHVVSSQNWFLNSIGQGKFDPEEPGPAPDSVADMAKHLDQGFQQAVTKIRALTGEQLLAITDFFGMKMPLYVYLNFALVHTVHHRGQLSTYLRALGSTCPDIYGGSADEPWQG